MMKKHAPTIIGLFFIALLLVAAGHIVRWSSEPPPAPLQISCARVVSLAPSITEMLFALGLGGRVVGVTRYCDHPDEARTKPKVGGFADPNYEQIWGAKPDVVFLLNLHKKQRAQLRELGVTTVALSADTLSGIYDAIHSIARICGVAPRGGKLVASMATRLAGIARLTKDRKRPKVLLSIGRGMGGGSLKEIFAAGKATFFNDVIALAGGQNAIQSHTVLYPRLSAEGVIALNPEVIVDLVTDLEDKAIRPDEILAQWQDAAHTDAVKKDRVHLLSQDYSVVPGPRIVLLAEQLARLIHPEIDWSKL